MFKFLKKHILEIFCGGMVLTALVSLAVVFLPSDVEEEVVAVSLTTQESVEVVVGDKVQVEYELSDERCMVAAKSSDTSICSCKFATDSTLYVTGLSEGSATLTITAKYGSLSDPKEVLVVVKSSTSSEDNSSETGESTEGSEDDDNSGETGENTESSSEDAGEEQSTSGSNLGTLTASSTEADLSAYLCGNVTVSGEEISISQTSNTLAFQNLTNSTCAVYVQNSAGGYEALSPITANIYILPTTSEKYSLLILITSPTGETHHQLFTVFLS